MVRNGASNPFNRKVPERATAFRTVRTDHTPLVWWI